MGSEMKTISYEYDSVGNRTLMIDPDGGRTTYAYDVLNRISSLINPQGERTTYAYDPKGRRTVKKLANGTRASFTYDAANRLTTLANLKSDNSVISKFDYKYDKVGNKTSVVEADGSRVSRIYDNTYQLIGEHRTGSSPYRNTFTYDSVGNRLLKNENNARTTYAYDDAHQLKTSVDAQGTTTYTFDDDGNQELVQAPTSVRTTTTWDYENKTTLVQLLTGLRNTMSYEPDGLRVKLEDSSGTKKFIWDNQTYLAETDENNDTQAVYTNEPSAYGNLISQYRKTGAIWTPSYYHQEALGSTRELTNSAEAITDQYLYDAWGNLISSTGTTINPFQYTGNVGYYYDEDTGNFYIRARIYRPTIGRWLSVDPLGFVDGINLYSAYFIPMSIDPSGEKVLVFGWEGLGGQPPLGLPPLLADPVIRDIYAPIAREVFGDNVSVDVMGQSALNPIALNATAHQIIDAAKTKEDGCCYPRIVLIGYSWGGWTLSNVVDRMETIDPEVKVDVAFTIDPVVGPLFAIGGRKIAGSNTHEQVSPVSGGVNVCTWTNFFQKTSTFPPFVGDRFKPASNFETRTANFRSGPYRSLGTQIPRNPELLGHILIPYLTFIQNSFRDEMVALRSFGVSRETFNMCGVSDVCPYEEFDFDS